MSFEIRKATRRCSKTPRIAETMEIDGEICLRVPLTKGQFAFVDIADAPLVTPWCWMARWHRNTYYAKRFVRVPGNGQKRKYIAMHNLILECPEGQTVDHINRNGLDNRRKNLRPATNGEQRLNTRKQMGTSSRFRGVSRNECRGKPWMASITVLKQNIYLGKYDTEEEAAKAYDAAAFNYWGSRATLNFEYELAKASSRVQG